MFKKMRILTPLLCGLTKKDNETALDRRVERLKTAFNLFNQKALTMVYMPLGICKCFPCYLHL